MFMLIPDSLMVVFFVLIAEGSSEVNKTILIKGLTSPLKEVHK